jgi:sodium transport system permease protein
MRWSIIRLIWSRELRDQLRDRRTLLMIAVLPVLLYPLAGLGMASLFTLFVTQSNKVGVVGAENVYPWRPGGLPANVGKAVGWFAAAPAAPGLAPLSAAVSFHLAPPRDYPPLLVPDEEGQLTIDPRYLPPPSPLGAGLVVKVLDDQAPDMGPRGQMLEAVGRSALERRQVDVLLVFPRGFQGRIHDGGEPPVLLLSREKDEASRLARLRLNECLERWAAECRMARFVRKKLPHDFDQVFQVIEERPPQMARLNLEITRLMGRVFPFILVLWSLCGALYPAVDLCAGEKERGTMETLLISPATREEIVYGKFLTIWVFSAATALLNLLSMALTTWWFKAAVTGTGLRLVALFWAVVLLLPLSAFFSAICLAVGAYARSSKEGQYYLMPLFFATMPLIGLTLAPGIELGPVYAMVPVTGVALLLQRLIGGPAMDFGAWAYLVPVVVPMLVYSWLGLRWAVAQFHSEEVLFREAEQVDLLQWARQLFREKEALPSAGEAIACFVVILGLRWFSFSIGGALDAWARTAVTQLAFVAGPVVFMAMLLTTSPREGLKLRWPPAWAWPMTVLLGLALLPILAEFTFEMVHRFPELPGGSGPHHPLIPHWTGAGTETWRAALVLALVPAVCEELAFRGLLLSGLSRAFHAWTAIALSAFFYGLYQMNVYQFVPCFLLGLVLGLLTIRTGSVFPAILLRAVTAAVVFWPGGDWGLTLLLACFVVVAAALAVLWCLGAGTPLPEGEGAGG